MKAVAKVDSIVLTGWLCADVSIVAFVDFPKRQATIVYTCSIIFIKLPCMQTKQELIPLSLSNSRRIVCAIG